MVRAGSVAQYAIAAALAATATGCFDLSDNRGPVMSIEVCWDEQPEKANVQGGNCANTDLGTCDSAGVDHMKWTLNRAVDGHQVAEGDEACANGIDIIEPAPGKYTLEITGTDSAGDAVWQHNCKGLDVLRFDIGYECDVEANLIADGSTTP